MSILTEKQIELMKDLILENTDIEGLPKIKLQPGETAPQVKIVITMTPVVDYVEGLVKSKLSPTKKPSKIKKWFSVITDKGRFVTTLTLFKSALSDISKVYKI